MNNKKKSTIILVSLFILLTILSFSLSYAYLTRVNNAETTTTIKADSGIMQIYLEGGARIEVTSFSPSATAFATKYFTVTGNTNTNQTMSYHIILVMESNTFSYDALKYKLTSTNTDGNGTIAPSITTMKEIGNGAREIFLGNGTFAGSTSGEKIHSYTLELYFPVTGGDQSHDQSKSFEGHIEIREGTGTANNYLSDAIVTAYGGSSTITAANSSLFNSISASNENSVYKMLDDYGISYYYRGAKDYVNNNIIFAEQQWKIVRINGDGSIRLIYNGTCPDNTCTINTTGTNTIIGTAAFAYDYLDNKRVGYMFSPYGSPANSTSRAQATTNEISQQIKEKVVDPWYNYNLLNTDYEDYISDTLFCNDRQLRSEVGGAATGTGFGTSITRYASYYRLNTNKTPTLKCGVQNDRFTVSDESIGNKDLTYPVGLLSADEIAIAGVVYEIDNSTNYLYTGQGYWLLSPAVFNVGSGSYSYQWDVSVEGHLGYSTSQYVLGVRPVINIKSSALFSGSGTIADPYIVEVSE